MLSIQAARGRGERGTCVRGCGVVKEGKEGGLTARICTTPGRYITETLVRIPNIIAYSKNPGEAGRSGPGGGGRKWSWGPEHDTRPHTYS